MIANYRGMARRVVLASKLKPDLGMLQHVPSHVSCKHDCRGERRVRSWTVDGSRR